MHPLRTIGPRGSLLLACVAALGCDSRETEPLAPPSAHASALEAAAPAQQPVPVTSANPAAPSIAESAPHEPAPAASVTPPRGKDCPATRLPAMPAKDLCLAYVEAIGATETDCTRGHFAATDLEVDATEVVDADSAQFPVIELAAGNKATVFAYHESDADADRYQLAVQSGDHWTIWPFAQMDHSGSRWTYDYVKLALRTESFGLGREQLLVIEWIVGYEIDNEYTDYDEEGSDHFMAALLPRGEAWDWLAIVPLPTSDLSPNARATVEWESGPHRLEVRDTPRQKARGPKGSFAYGAYPAVCPGEEALLPDEAEPEGSTDPLPTAVVELRTAWTPIAASTSSPRRHRRLCRAEASLLDKANAIDKYAVPAGLDEDVWVRAVESLQSDFEVMGSACDEKDYDQLDRLVGHAKQHLTAVVELVEGS